MSFPQPFPIQGEIDYYIIHGGKTDYYVTVPHIWYHEKSTTACETDGISNFLQKNKN